MVVSKEYADFRFPTCKGTQSTDTEEGVSRTPYARYSYSIRRIEYVCCPVSNGSG
jgi:hypothetical protein